MASPKRVSFSEFREQFQGFSELDASDMQDRKSSGVKGLAGLKGIQARKELTTVLYKKLLESSPEEVLAFGEELRTAIDKHEQHDTLELAHAEGRAIYRSWHHAGAYDRVDSDDNPENKKAAEKAGTKTGAPRVGFDALNVSLNPSAFRTHKEAYRSGTSKFGPAIEVPATLMSAKDRKPQVFSDMHSTVTALLPEDHYAAFFAFNEAAKHMQRQNTGSMTHEWGAVAAHAKSMRESVTRPVLFDFDDLGSGAYALADKDSSKAAHVRKGATNIPERHSGFEKKMEDSERAHAVFYQSFYDRVDKYEKQNKWNEMVVKFRSTGHTAPTISHRKEMASVVPELNKWPSLDISPTAKVTQSARENAKTFDVIKPPGK